MTSAHAIKCKLNGRGLAMKLGGGWCVCPSANECRMRGEWEREEQRGEAVVRDRAPDKSESEGKT
jgi:hypothetical protein